jgi:hypothetical protein
MTANRSAGKWSAGETKSSLSVRCRSERPAPLESLRAIVERSGGIFVAGWGVSRTSTSKPSWVSCPTSRKGSLPLMRVRAPSALGKYL